MYRDFKLYCVHVIKYQFLSTFSFLLVLRIFINLCIDSPFIVYVLLVLECLMYN